MNNWFWYLCKTSWKQKKQDWKEYRMLKMDVDVAQHNLNVAYENLVYSVEEDVFNDRNSCLKNFIIKADFVKKHPIIENKKVVAAVIKSRCTNFAPEKDEVLCCCANCECFSKNAKYFDALQKVKQLDIKYNAFWTQKLQQAAR